MNNAILIVKINSHFLNYNIQCSSLDYIESLYETFVDATSYNLLKEAKEELDAMAPAPMNTMLDKQPREEALELWKRRKTMTVQEVPSTLTGSNQSES